MFLHKAATTKIAELSIAICLRYKIGIYINFCSSRIALPDILVLFDHIATLNLNIFFCQLTLLALVFS